MTTGIQKHRKRWRARVQVDGKRTIATFETRAEAEEWRARAEAAAKYRAAGLTPPGAPEPTRSLQDILDALAREQEAVGRTEKTIQQTRATARLVDRALGPIPAPITRDQVVRLIAWCRDPAHTKSRNGRSIRAALGIIATAHRRAGLPVPQIPRIEVQSTGRPRVTLDELRRFLGCMAIGSVERTFAELVIRTGRRDSEIRRLTSADVDLDGLSLRVTRRKRAATGAPIIQIFPIHPALERILRPYATWRGKANPGDPFLTIDGTHPLSEFSLQKRFRSAYRRAELPEHSGIAWLRNQAATLLGDAGAPVEALRRWLGHASVTTTEKHYDWSRRDELHSLLGDAIDTLLSGTTGGTIWDHSTPRKRKK